MEASHQSRQISELKEEAAQKATELRARDADLANMAQAEAAMRGDVGMAQSQVAQQAAEMATLRKNHDEAVRQVVAAQSTLASKATEMAALRASLVEAEEEMKLAGGATAAETLAATRSSEMREAGDLEGFDDVPAQVQRPAVEGRSPVLRGGGPILLN